MDLQNFFLAVPEAAVAFSGGSDSAFLLYAAKRYSRRVGAYFVQTEFQPEFELRDAEQVAQELSVPLRVLSLEILKEEPVAENPENRCYLCKRRLFSVIRQAAEEDGFSVVLDGTHASDREEDRPGMRALREMGVRSPLRECGLEKEQIREESRKAGIPVWAKPSYACLATRIPTGERITAEKLETAERAERLLASLGLTDFRVRLFRGAARIQVPEEQMPLVLECRESILRTLSQDYSAVLLDLEAR